MLRVIALSALATLAAGCTVKDPCASGTVLVSLTLDGATAQADELVVDVAIDGGDAHESTLAHTSGGATGNVVVKFPSGYPHGHSVAVEVIALAAGVELGRTNSAVTLGDSCETLALTLEPGASGDDLSSGGDDLSPAPDLTPPADLAKCVPTTEQCFDGIDNDCDGHIDCDDPDCTTVATCVPAVTAPFVVGTTLNPISLCPTGYGTSQVINSGLTAAANCSTGCSCGTSCFAQLNHFGSAAGNCPNTDNENQFSLVYDTMCQSWSSGMWDGTLDVHQLNTPAQCSLSGTPSLPGVSWAASKRACQTASVGGGCSAGNVCVPITPGPKCEVAAGTHGCDPGYNAVTGPWFLDYSDTRACSCSCGPPTSGSCGSTVTLYTATGCGGSATSFAANLSNNINCTAGGPFLSGKILPASPPVCGSPTYNPETGSLVGTGPQTLCCAP
jgi:hypothetical protein